MRSFRPPNIANRHDHNRDGRLNILDYALARANYGRPLAAFTTTIAASPPAAPSALRDGEATGLLS